MSRHVDITQPLSDADRQYLLDRSRHDLIAQADAIAAGTEYSDSMLTSTGVPLTGDELPPNTGSVDNTGDPRGWGSYQEPNEDDGDEDGEPDYDTWKKAELEAEAHNRGLDKSGTKAEIAERLREHDAAEDDDQDDDES